MKIHLYLPLSVFVTNTPIQCYKSTKSIQFLSLFSLIQDYSGKTDQINKSVKEVQINPSTYLEIYSASVTLKKTL